LTKSHKNRAGKGQAETGQQQGSGAPGQGNAGNREAREAKPLVGGVLHDDRGNAVWHWASDTARNAAVSTSALLRRLNVSSLSLEETQDEERRQAAAWAAYSAAAAAGKSAVPGKSALTGKSAPAGKTGAPGKTAASGTGAVPGKPRVRTSWWRRLFQRR
jgi:hypothetical protein